MLSKIVTIGRTGEGKRTSDIQVEVYNTASVGLVVRGPGACDGSIDVKYDGELGLVLKQANTVCFLNVGRTDFFGAANLCQPVAA